MHGRARRWLAEDRVPLWFLGAIAVLALAAAVLGAGRFGIVMLFGGTLAIAYGVWRYRHPRWWRHPFWSRRRWLAELAGPTMMIGYGDKRERANALAGVLIGLVACGIGFALLLGLLE